MKKLYWFLVGNRNVGSARIAGFNLHEEFIRQGFRSEIVSVPDRYFADLVCSDEKLEQILFEEPSILIFQKACGNRAKKFAKQAKEKGHRIVFTSGDWFTSDMYDLADVVVVGSPDMKGKVEKTYNRSNVYYIDDGLEVSNSVKIHEDKDILTLGWFGNYMKLTEAAVVALRYTSSKIRFFSVSNTSSANVCMGDGTPNPWDVKKLEDFLLKHVDIMINPIKITEMAVVKSANRVTLAMALGIPVITTSIPTYELVIKNGVNGFLCKTDEEWDNAINILSSKEERERVGKHSADEIRSRFSIGEIAKRYSEVIIG